jgi:hypothetical protein
VFLCAAFLQTFLQWREAEALACAPHSFSRLKQLPELRQIISHTCLDAVQAAAGRMTQHLVENAVQQFSQRRERWQDKEHSGRDTDSDDDTGIASGIAPEKLYIINQEHKNASLLSQLAPGLRLCLAAEVAVGMLCAG